MPDAVFQEAEKFIEKARKLGDKYVGRVATKEEIEILKDKFGDKIPTWYYKLISELPLIQMAIGWKAFEPEEDFNGIIFVKINQPIDMIEESFEYYPGIPILEKGFVCIGEDMSGGGNPYFINFNSTNPPIFQIYHDSGHTSEDILKYGKRKVAHSLVDFFRYSPRILKL
jgi:hypothetical protein